MRTGKLLSIFWPDDPNWSPLERARHRILAALSGIALSVASAQFLTHIDLYFSNPVRLAMIVTYMAACGSAPFFAAKTWRVEGIAKVLLGVCLLVLAYTTSTVGLQAPSTPILAVHGIASVMLLGVKYGVGSAIAGVTTVAISYLRYKGSGDVEPFLIGSSFALTLAASLIAVVIFTVIYAQGMVTALKEIDRGRENAERANKSKSDFLANMSHEIRTPMNGIIGSAELVLDTPLSSDQKLYVNTIHASSTALLTLINDILDLSKIEADKLSIIERPFYLRSLVTDLSGLLLPAASSKSVRLETTINDDVPLNLIGDDGRLRQVLANIIGNAIKFTHEGSVSVIVSVVEQSSDRPEVVFTVKDTGIGIPEDKIDLVFEKFTQAESSTTRDYGGTGLGLAITKRLIDLMGGGIKVRSKVGHGAEVTIKIPFARSAEVTTAKPELIGGGTASTVVDQNSRGLKILIVDDNAVNQMVLSRMLGLDTHEIQLADNGASAIELASSFAFDVIFMDISMPVMGGEEAMREIRSKERAKSVAPAPIIALTAHAMEGDRSRFLDAGFDDYLAKPVKRKELFAILHRFRPRPSTVNTEQMSA